MTARRNDPPSTLSMLRRHLCEDLMPNMNFSAFASRRAPLAARLALAFFVACAAVPAVAAEQTWTVNFKETDIQELIRFVAKATDKTIIIDPVVKGKIQVVSSKPVNQQELYDLFLSVLEVHGFSAIESGGVTRIIPSKDARSAPVPVVPEEKSGTNSEVITQVIQLENISAAKLIPVLRPLAPQQAHMAAYEPSNAIIVSDTAANIQRIRDIIQRIDRDAVQTTEVLRLEHASAEEVVRMLEELARSDVAKGQADTKKLTMVADKRTNSVLINGDGVERARVRALIRNLDKPMIASGNVRVVYLEYANAEDISEVLNKLVKNVGSEQDKTRPASQTTASVEADEGTNSLIITADADIMQSLLAVVRQLDIRRAQVLVEAIIVELSNGDAQSLGVEWLFLNNNGAYGANNNAGLNKGIVEALQKADGDDAEEVQAGLAGAVASVPGQVLGVGRIDDDLSFNVVVNALKTNEDANILSTPSLLTLDNEEASITVGENVPFVTGSYTSTGNSTNPSDPFQTVERENVGITLKITPQINEGNSLVLEISQEVSNVVPTEKTLNGNVITSERKIETKVLAGNGQTIVLGGLMEDKVTEAVSKVPLLGDIPFIGALFRSSGTTVDKTHLLVFIRPTIIRDDTGMNDATAEKYSRVRNRQLQDREQGVDFLRDEDLPLLPEWQRQLEEMQRMRSRDEGARAPTGG